jgi:hypothetical protein
MPLNTLSADKPDKSSPWLPRPLAEIERYYNALRQI